MKRRNLIFVTLMSLVTLGIYDIYWAFSTRDELVKKGHNVPSPLIVLLPLLGLIGVALVQIIIHLAGANGGFETFINVISITVGVLVILAIIPMLIVWLWRYSKAVEKLTKGDFTAEISMVIAILSGIVGLSLIWPIVVQYHYNNLANRT